MQNSAPRLLILQIDALSQKVEALVETQQQQFHLAMALPEAAQDNCEFINFERLVY
jgi:hypothetical protein